MHLIIVTTVPETLIQILNGQPKYLSESFNVSLVTSPGPLSDHLHSESVPVHLVPMFRGFSVLKDVKSLIKMIAVFRRERPSIVHSYTGKAGIISMVAAYLTRVPVRVHTFTGLVWPCSKKMRYFILLAVDKLICALATNVLAESEGVRSALQSKKVTSKKIDMIGRGNIAGVDVSYFSPEAKGVAESAASLRKQLGFYETDFVFVYVGRLNRDKGLEELVSSFERFTSGVRLLVVGGADNVFPISHSLFERIRTNSSIHWIGFQEDIRASLKAADVLVLPSYREGFPNVVLQSFAMCCPVIATNVSGSNEIVEHGVNGWLVEPRNESQLAMAMTSALFSSKEKLISMGKSGRLVVIADFERTEHWTRIKAFYSSLASNVR